MILLLEHPVMSDGSDLVMKMEDSALASGFDCYTPPKMNVSERNVKEWLRSYVDRLVGFVQYHNVFDHNSRVMIESTFAWAYYMAEKHKLPEIQEYVSKSVNGNYFKNVVTVLITPSIFSEDFSISEEFEKSIKSHHTFMMKNYMQLSDSRANNKYLMLMAHETDESIVTDFDNVVKRYRVVRVEPGNDLTS
jgi:hypothetical protein